MCGIFAVVNDKSNAAGQTVFSGLKTLEYRGYDSWGVAVKLDNGKIYLEKHAGKIGEAKLPKFNSKSGFGHTRWATHGGVTPENAHPHADCQNKIIVVHNGIIENFLEIKKNLLKKGHHFKSQTDTEVLPHLLEEQITRKNDLKKLILSTSKKLEGLSAFIIFFPEREEFYAIKNSSPLVFGADDKSQQYFIASDYAGILPHTGKIYFLEDNELLKVSKESYHLYNQNGSEKKIKFLKLEQKKENLSLGKYKHFMLKEINEQPRVLTNIVENQKENIIKLANVIKKSYGNYLIGCGSAYYACLAGTYMFSKIAKRHTNASIASEFSYLIDFLKDTSLVIPLSQSGETIDIISSIKVAKEKSAKIFAITNVLGSTLYRMADYKMLLNAGPEKCVLATKSFTAKLAILHLLAHCLNSGYNSGASEIRKAISEIKKIIKAQGIRELAKNLKNKEHIYVLGRGISYPIALEAALKIKEVSYIHAEGFAGGELKHGVIALIESGTPVIIFNPQDETYKDTLSSAYEVKARGAHIIGISSIANQVYDEFIKVEDCGEATSIANVVVAQLLGYFLALEKGNDPDKPRNLAKSVTVK